MANEASHVHEPEAGTLRPWVVARRWDQLGARLGAIANALSTAELLDLEFRFVWPPGVESALDDPVQIFSSEFLDAFQIQPSELEHRPCIPHRELLSLADADARQAVRTAGTNVFVEVDELFDIVRFPTESTGVAAARFTRCFDEIDWSEEIREVIAFCSRWPRDGAIAAVHVRAGDIVTGAWRHVLVHEKYSPTPFIHHAIERLASNGERQVLVLSDNPAYRTWLKERFPTVTTAPEILPGYGRLTELQQALADVLILSRCEPIVGPPSSAFSKLAANLGAGRIVRADQLIEHGQQCDALCLGIAERLKEPSISPSWGGLVARDICWCLDVFGDDLSFRRGLELARRAAALDPEFVGALTRFARLAAVAGDWRTARNAAARAVRIAQSAEHRDDPLMEALATDIVSRCFARVGERGRRFDRWRGRDPELDVVHMERALHRCKELYPFWLARDAIFEHLRFLISAVERLGEATPTVRRQAARRLAKASYDDVDLRRLRPQGLDAHRALPMYDPLTRDLDRVTLHLYLAVHRAGVAIDAPRLARVSGRAD